MNEQSRLSQAFELADWLHKEQFRKQADNEKHLPLIPYMTHLAEVMAIVMQGYGDEDQQIAALLHDAIEDQDPAPDGRDTQELIGSMFGPRVLQMVLACTDGESGLPRTPETWRPRKEEHLTHMRELAPSFPDFLLVSIADKISNVTAINNDVLNHGNVVWQRFNASPNDLQWYYTTLFGIYSETLGEDHHLVKRLHRQVVQLADLVQQA